MEAHSSIPLHRSMVRPVATGCGALLRRFRRARTPPCRLIPLVTQSYDSPESLPQTTRWTCLGKPATRVPPLLRLSYWIGASLFVPGTRKYRVSVASVCLTALKLLIAWPLLSILVLWSENLGLFQHSANNSIDNGTTSYDAVLLPEETDVKSEDEGARSEALSLDTEATTPLLANNEIDEAPTAERAHTNYGVLRDILTDSLSSIKEVVSPDIVILNHVHGASSHWDNLDPEPYFDSSKSLCGLFFHLAACWCLLTPVYIAFCIYHKVFHGHDMRHQPQWLAWLVFVSVPVTAAIALLAPAVLLATLTRARRPFKSRLVGIEGIVDAAVLEKYLWGFDHGNLTETTARSYRESDEMQQESIETRRDFTLLDTHLMTVTHFRSHVPPTAMFVVGEEAGKQRALLCSYNHRNETFHREEILKSDPRSLE